MEQKKQVRLIVGRGIEGDRYHRDNNKGFYNHLAWSQYTTVPANQLTLIPVETLEQLQKEHGYDIGPHNNRSNICTQGLPLKKYTGCEIRIGREVVLFAVQARGPCTYLETLTGNRGLFDAFSGEDMGVHCDIIQGGTVYEGDFVEVLPETKNMELAKKKRVDRPSGFDTKPSLRSPDQKKEMVAWAFSQIRKAETSNDPTLWKTRIEFFFNIIGRYGDDWDGGANPGPLDMTKMNDLKAKVDVHLKSKL
eukprot:gnl/TRDRNA2_/TRDRNA2_146464_c0_seq1.p1 gnl/TRDRNA2_/TRDRNA2_146464_c0~~gnl/TRDRNA2_/TRDRNA2_146464_c0_seq1.p1  ORF type:complete len:281 (+),score=36.70 gnl/TRDRNA2_/TRDRNA2_146464_c0_seq1:95-844(+)